MLLAKLDPVSSGVRQRTDLGLWLFIMVSDFVSETDLWKYVDDMTVSEIEKAGLVMMLKFMRAGINRNSSLFSL